MLPSLFAVAGTGSLSQVVSFLPTHCGGKGAHTQHSYRSLLCSAGLARLTLAATHWFAVLHH